MLKQTFFLFVVFMLSGNYGFCKMQGLSNKQLQNFVSNESICYEKIDKSCAEFDKPVALLKNKKDKSKSQLEMMEDTLFNEKYSSAVVGTEGNVNLIERQPVVIHVNSLDTHKFLR